MKPEIEILARTIYGEARGELNRLDGGIASLIAIGNVVMNRVHQKKWYGKTVTEVCLKPWQFSCWNSNDPNYEVLMGPLSGKLIDTCQYIAERLINEQWPDLTGGCDHYHATTLRNFPSWTLKTKAKCRIGQHIFYDLRTIK